MKKESKISGIAIIAVGVVFLIDSCFLRYKPVMQLVVLSIFFIMPFCSSLTMSPIIILNGCIAIRLISRLQQHQILEPQLNHSWQIQSQITWLESEMPTWHKHDNGRNPIARLWFSLSCHPSITFLCQVLHIWFRIYCNV